MPQPGELNGLGANTCDGLEDLWKPTVKDGLVQRDAEGVECFLQCDYFPHRGQLSRPRAPGSSIVDTADTIDTLTW